MQTGNKMASTLLPRSAHKDDGRATKNSNSQKQQSLSGVLSLDDVPGGNVQPVRLRTGAPTDTWPVKANPCY
jgi:hypothetical protein